MQAKIRELYKASQAQQAAEMMGPNGQPINPYTGVQYNNMTAAAMMGLNPGAYQNIQQQSLQGRNPYNAGYPAAAPPSMYNSAYQVAPTRSLPVHPNVVLSKLPFYDLHAELLKPATLVAHGGNRFQDAQFQFLLTPSQATSIAANRDIQIGSRLDYLNQVLYYTILQYCSSVHGERI
jgi:hypothetical protein